jgi:uncharacterized membrane protein YkoI
MNRSSAIHLAVPKDRAMRRLFATAVLLIALWAPGVAAAAEKSVCLSKAEQRAAIAQGKVVTLAAAIRAARGSVRGRGAREVVRARLCRGSNGLVYVLTVLARNGKVTRTTVDASTGKTVEGR